VKRLHGKEPTAVDMRLPRNNEDGSHQHYSLEHPNYPLDIKALCSQTASSKLGADEVSGFGKKAHYDEGRAVIEKLTSPRGLLLTYLSGPTRDVVRG
jgi:hypothetical protein